MRIYEVKSSVCIQPDNLVASFQDTLVTNLQRSNIDQKTSFIASSDCIFAGHAARNGILICGLFLLIIPIIAPALYCFFGAVICTDVLSIHDPTSILERLGVLALIAITLPVVWWYYNTILAQAVYYSIFSKIIKSFDEHRYSEKARSTAIEHYIACARKEWDYND
jgi:hypothetical protein